MTCGKRYRKYEVPTNTQDHKVYILSSIPQPQRLQLLMYLNPQLEALILHVDGNCSRVNTRPLPRQPLSRRHLLVISASESPLYQKHASPLAQPFRQCTISEISASPQKPPYPRSCEIGLLAHG